VFGGVLLFHPCWVVSLALAGLASGFGMGPGVSLPLLTAVTLFTFVECPTWWWGILFVAPLVLLVVGCGLFVGVVASVVGKFSAG
jgi:hypothetical protein